MVRTKNAPTKQIVGGSPDSHLVDIPQPQPNLQISVSVTAIFLFIPYTYYKL